MTSGPGLDFFRDDPDALLLERGEGGGDVVYAERDMVETGAALLEEAGDGGVGRGRLQKLNAAAASGKHGDPDLLVRDGLLMRDAEAEGLVKSAGGGEGFDGDSEMIDSGHGISIQQSAGIPLVASEVGLGNLLLALALSLIRLN